LLDLLATVAYADKRKLGLFASAFEAPISSSAQRLRQGRAPGEFFISRAARRACAVSERASWVKRVNASGIFISAA
jgi:hypothetical protein